ncbi:MAG: SpoIIE family protein phosphatase [Planctomycetales bacterium]|nr:SpoIIE family protein phosphatase [Planctomycetales bacterium]
MTVLNSVESSPLRVYAGEDLQSFVGASPSADTEPSVASSLPPAISHLQTEDAIPAHAARRMELLLKGAAELTDCHAVAIYLLDDSTSKLSLRHAVGLAADALVAPPRPLAGAVADIEALAGNAVVLEDKSLYPYWRVPHGEFEAAACVPIASASSILGTLWFFSKAPRSFTAKETHLFEIVAGRVASDLQYEQLRLETVTGARLERQWSEEARRQKALQPTAPALAGSWAVSSWTHQAEGIGGALVEWLCDEQDQFKLIAAQAMERGLAAAISAASLRGGLRLLARQYENPAEILAAASSSMWTASAGDRYAAALAGSIDTNTGDFRYAVAGQMHGILISGQKTRRLELAAPPLGVDAEVDFPAGRTRIAPGSILVILSEGAGRLLRRGKRSPEGQVVSILRKYRHQTLSEQLAAIAREAESSISARNRYDATIVALRRLKAN